jgi:hypothetical protein
MEDKAMLSATCLTFALIQHLACSHALDICQNKVRTIHYCQRSVLPTGWAALQQSAYVGLAAARLVTLDIGYV